MTRIEREKEVVARMILTYCHRNHSTVNDDLCPECRQLSDYAMRRLSRCPKQNAKRSCRKCEIHCYAPIQRQRIRIVMKTIGPKMLWISPVAAIRHLIDELL
ncbi:MAG: nitrous oxide-stimulated promoter family protein [Muribaculaceae bacterium]|nr:nitrous oxide-stimulated promoter family protein [Muribaculaceae bacterium]